MFVQTEWVKPYNQIMYYAQITLFDNLAATVSITPEELYSPYVEEIKEAKKRNLRLAIHDLIDQDLDRLFANFNWPGKPYENQRREDKGTTRSV